MTYRMLRNKEGTNEIHDERGVCVGVVVPVELPRSAINAAWNAAHINGQWTFAGTDDQYRDAYAARIAAAPADLSGAVVKVPERQAPMPEWPNCNYAIEGFNTALDALARALEVKPCADCGATHSPGGNTLCPK